MLRIETSYADLVAKLRARESFAFSRWGDGEWFAVLGRDYGSNCDGHPYSKALGQDLTDVLLSRPPYLLGMQNLAMGRMGSSIEEFLEGSGLSDLPWCNSDIFHREAIRGGLKDLVDALNDRDLTIVGPDHLRKLTETHFPQADFVSVPPRNAYAKWQAVCADVALSLAGRPDAVVSLSMGMPAELALDRLYHLGAAEGANWTLIDFGSLWDPFVGVLSRSYMKRDQFDPLAG